MIEKKEIQVDASKRKFRTASIVLSWIWGLLLIPIVVLSFMAGIATMMFADSGQVSELGMTMIVNVSFLFWGMPVVVLLAFLLSFECRKKLRFEVVLQLAPVIYLGITIGMLCLLIKVL